MGGRWLVLALGIAAGLFALALGGRYQARGFEESALACRYNNVLLVLDTWTGRVSCQIIEDTAPPTKKPNQP